MLKKAQREILMGIFLGNARLETTNSGRTFRLVISQPEDHLDYVNHLFEMFKAFTVVPEPKLKESKPVLNDICKSYQFRTRSCAEFRFYYHQFYSGGVKVVPKLIHRWLAPRTLAYWFMDSGLVKANEHTVIVFNTRSFDLPSVNRLSKAMKFKYGWDCSVHKQATGYVLQLRSDYVSQFFDVCGQFILDSMKYKILPKLTEMPKR